VNSERRYFTSSLVSAPKFWTIGVCKRRRAGLALPQHALRYAPSVPFLESGKESQSTVQAKSPKANQSSNVLQIKMQTTTRSQSASLASVSCSYPSNTYHTSAPTASTRSRITRGGHGRLRTARPRTGVSTIAGNENQHIVCAISESRGVAPTVGLAFVNMDTGEAVLCQISDSQTYVRTIHKLKVYEPSELLIVSTAANPKSKLFSIIEENISTVVSSIKLLDRKYWAEATGLEYIQQLAFSEDVEALKVSVDGNYFAVCCIAAASSEPATCVFSFLIDAPGIEVY